MTLLCLNFAWEKGCKIKILRAVVSMVIPKVKFPPFYFWIVSNSRCYRIMENIYL